MNTRHSLMILAALGLSLNLEAQTPGRQVNEVDSQQPVVSAVVRKAGARKQVDAYLKELKGGGIDMRQGLNRRPRDDGGDFWVGIGIAEIAGNRSSPDWVTSRALAFDKAMAAAKGDLVAQVSADIESHARGLLKERSDGIVDQVESPEAPESTYDKVSELLQRELDERLGTAGPESGRSAQRAGEAYLRSEEFRNAVKMSSRAIVSGMQAFQTFEDLEAGRNGEIAVLAIVSDKTLQLAASLGAGRPLPRGKAGQPLDDQIPYDDSEDGALQLLCTFGVKTMYDEKGELCLVSFNQARPLNQSAGAELSAKRRAGTFAAGAIRQFLGEQICRVEDVFRSESVKEFTDNTRQSESVEGGQSLFEATAEKINITGLNVIREWTARHPVTGQLVCGSVVSWSPGSKDFANALRGDMARSAAAAPSDSLSEGAASPREPVLDRRAINSDQEGVFRRRGLRGDKEGF